MPVPAARMTADASASTPVDIHAGLAQLGGLGDARVELGEAVAERVREVGGEGGEHDAGVRVAAGQLAGPVDEHDGLAGSGAAGEPERPVVALLDVAALLGVQEHAPRPEVALLDDLPQLLLVADEGELGRGSGLPQGPEQVGVLRRPTGPAAG